VPLPSHLSTLQVKGQLLRELLVESKAYGYLLGSGGAGGWLLRESPAGKLVILNQPFYFECTCSVQAGQHCPQSPSLAH